MFIASAVMLSLNCMYLVVSWSSTSTGTSAMSKKSTLHTRHRSPMNLPIGFCNAPCIWYTYLLIHTIMQKSMT
jgi:hypothetical protein